MLDKILIEAYENCASDIHLVVGQKPIFRIDGELVYREEYVPFTSESLLGLIKESFLENDVARFLENRELDVSYDIKNITRFRVNMYYERENPCFVARIISKKIPTMDELSMPNAAKSFVNANKGLVLVTGPTGSGKSSSLAAMIDLINETQKKNILTIEDPIEFLYESKKSLITQRQLGSDTLSFPNALKHVLRQDPNIIMVGEMRDLETIMATITLAESGHLVFSTLHTFNAAQTIDRIIDVFPTAQQAQIRTQLAIVLLGVISQRLIPKIGGGRVAIREVLVNNSAVANLIRENKVSQINTIIQTGAEEDMFSIGQDLKKFINAGIVSPEWADII